ncbi:probable thiopurine S-methyltransferase [Liolophura sinensis]|uniref:probable thiopurine S-methyltransferase n=1 Tax=Liolophura sinensis TaxID=3198878 RepID=UPI0031595B37
MYARLKGGLYILKRCDHLTTHIKGSQPRSLATWRKVHCTARYISKMTSNTDASQTGGVAPKAGVLEKVDTLEYWLERWEQRDIGFHMENVNKSLEKHIDRLLKGRQNLRLFIPLCGKTVDIKWLADQGHTVVGVEISEQAINEFFSEHNLEFTKKAVQGFDGPLYKSSDEKIRLYCGDLFHFNRDLEGQFDGIWDRASLVAINRDDRKKYSELILSLMNPDCVYLLHTVTYDHSKYEGPPRSTTLDEVQQLYGK